MDKRETDLIQAARLARLSSPDQMEATRARRELAEAASCLRSAANRLRTRRLRGQFGEVGDAVGELGVMVSLAETWLVDIQQ